MLDHCTIENLARDFIAFGGVDDELNWRPGLSLLVEVSRAGKASALGVEAAP